MSYQKYYMPTQSFLQNVFQNVDKNQSGAISIDELQEALSYGQWKPFNPKTVGLIFNMFDVNKTGAITFDLFTNLWKYIIEWQNNFRSFDRDNSGSINRTELKAALSKFGFSISEDVLNLIMRKYDRFRKDTIYFDDFIQCCVTLQRLTDEFKKFDADSNGWVKMHYNQFLNISFYVDP